MEREALRRRVDAVRWYHEIDFGDGIVSRAPPHSGLRQRQIPLPELRGKSVLDVGAWDGFFSFEAERRGAKRVLATDHYCWSGPGEPTQEGFLLAREALGSRVEDLDIDVMELCPERVGVFDVVLFLGVLYHVRDPFGALERVASVAGETLVVETAVDHIHLREPALAFYPGDELAGDGSNWFAPNPPALLAMLRAVGFEGEVVSWAARSRSGRLRRRLAAGLPFLPTRWLGGWRRDRVVVHATRR